MRNTSNHNFFNFCDLKQKNTLIELTKNRVDSSYLESVRFLIRAKKSIMLEKSNFSHFSYKKNMKVFGNDFKKKSK